MKHFWEFNPAASENPAEYYYCGHAALQIVGDYYGKYRKLTPIHNTFLANVTLTPSGEPNYATSNFCGNKHCSKVYDLKNAALSNQKPEDYNFDLTYIYHISSREDYFQKMKDGIKYNHPPIVESKWLYPLGHFYVLVGYKEVKEKRW